MRVFITGGTGTIGGPVVVELLHHGHRVLALARSVRSADALQRAGAEVLRGGLQDLGVLRAGAAQAPTRLQPPWPRRAPRWRPWGEALTGSDRPIVTVSGTPWVAGRAATEADPLPFAGPVAERARSVHTLLALASRGVRASAVRMPRTVHDQGRGGFAGLLVEQARRSGVVGYPGDGRQRWPAVHARDAANLFRVALESAPPGTAWHAVADEGDAVRDIALAIGRRLGLPVEAVPEEVFGPFGPIFAMDQPASSAHTRATLGWTPTSPSLLQDLENIRP